MGRITLSEGDITDQEVDALVNAANEKLVLGSGVAGAIAEKGGRSIQDECDAHGPVEVGGVAMTTAGALPAGCIIHAAGMPLGGSASEESVRAATKNSLALARDRGLRSIALPALGTGVGGLGLQRCAEIMLEEAEAHLAGDTSLEEIRFVLFGEPAYRMFEMTHDAAKVRAQMERLKRRK